MWRSARRGIWRVVYQATRGCVKLVVARRLYRMSPPSVNRYAASTQWKTIGIGCESVTA